MLFRSKFDFLTQLQGKPAQIQPASNFPAVDKTSIYIVDVPNAAQTEFRIGNYTGLKYDATGEYYRAGLMNYPLGGAFNSRINLNLREDKGWTYGARSAFQGNKWAGPFVAAGGILGAATDSAVVEFMKELNK